MAGLRGCQDDSPLAGVCCTNMCKRWRDCKIASQPILIYSTMMKGAVIADQSQNCFKLKEFPDWKNFDHNHSGVKAMTFFQSDARTSSMFDDSEINTPKEKEPRIIWTSSIQGTIQTDTSNNSFLLEESQTFVPFIKIVQVS